MLKSTTHNEDNPSAIPLLRFPSLFLASNTPKGRGVFTSHPIPAGTIIETSPVLVLDPSENSHHIEKTDLYHYTYNWPTTPFNLKPENHQQQRQRPNRRTTQAVVFGLGSMFNHSTQNQNVGWTRDLENRLVVYRALRDISEGEELCISYGDHLTFVDADAQTQSNGVEEEDEEEALGRIQLGP